jgi:hypothetical protein
VCQELRIWRTRAYRAAENTPTSPAQRLYGLYRALPGGAGLLSPSLADNSTSLTPASRRQDHTTSPYAATRLRQKASPGKRHSPMACCVHRIPRPTCRDDGDTPLWRARDGKRIIPIFRNVKRNLFACRGGNPNQLEIAQKIRFSAQRICACFCYPQDQQYNGAILKMITAR